jgi:hypothetical protein
MNTVFKSLGAAMLLLGSANALAASSVDLSVIGLITPSACTPELSNGGNVDYGKIAAKDLNKDQKTPLPTQIVQFSVACDGATLMAMKAKDNREGSAAENDFMQFGLGLINDTEKLGGMELKLLNPIADSVPVAMVSSEDGGVTWNPDRYLTRNNLLAPATAGVNAPISVQLWTADLNVMPYIAKASGLTLDDEAAIDGSVTLTVHYL